MFPETAGTSFILTYRSSLTIATVRACIALPAVLVWAIGKIQPYFKS